MQKKPFPLRKDHGGDGADVVLDFAPASPFKGLGSNPNTLKSHFGYYQKFTSLAAYRFGAEIMELWVLSKSNRRRGKYHVMAGLQVDWVGISAALLLIIQLN